MTVSELVTNIWPVTEVALSAYSSIDYAAAKVSAIDRAKRDLYGVGITVPTETSIPDVAQYWIADKSLVYLIPIGIDYYMTQHRMSDSKENANYSYYDKVRSLKDLEKELKAAIAKGMGDALDSIDNSDAPESYESSPAVSVDGLLLDPTARAFYRGSF
jgi:hypothetical protein